MISLGNATVCSDEAFYGNSNDLKEIWKFKGRFWNSFISEFKVISYIEDMLFLDEEVTKYDPCPDTLYAPWLPQCASPTFGCLQRLNYVWSTYCKRCVSNRKTPQMLDLRRSQLEEYTHLAESMQKCLDLCFMPRSGVSMDYYPSFRYRCIISVFSWSIFLKKDFETFLLALTKASIDLPPTVVVVLFSNDRLWNGELFWNKDDFIVALTTFLTNACTTHNSVHVWLTTKFSHIKNENMVKNDILMISNIITQLPFWNASSVDVHILCSNFLVYFTGEKLFHYNHTKECSEDGFNTVETLCLQLMKAKGFEKIKSLLNLKFCCYEYSIFTEKLNATKKHLNNGGGHWILQHITLCEFILLTLPQRVHYILSTLAPCYIHVKKIQTTKYLVEIDTGLLVNVLSHLFNYHSKLLNNKIGCNMDEYKETFQTTVWDPFTIFRHYTDSMLLSQFCYPPWLEASLKKKSISTFNLTPNSIKEALENFRIPLYETFIYFYFKSLCCSPMLISRQLLSNYQDILCLQNVTIVFSTLISDRDRKNTDPPYSHDEESDTSISSFFFEKPSVDCLTTSSQLDSSFIELRKLIFLIGVKILTFHDFFHSQIILGKFFLLLADIGSQNVNHVKSLFFLEIFQPFVNTFTSSRCCDINLLQLSEHSTLTYIWTSILVQLVDQQRIINSFNALLDCRVEDHVVALFTVTDFVDNTPEASYKLLLKVMLCFKNSTQAISIEKFYKNSYQIFPRLTIDEICIATIHLLCDVKDLTVAPLASQCLCELHLIFQNSETVKTFYFIVNKTLYTIAYTTLSTLHPFNLKISTFCKSVLNLRDPYCLHDLNKDLTLKINVLHHILLISDTCLSLIESLTAAPYIQHFPYNHSMTFLSRDDRCRRGKSIYHGLPFLFVPWIEQHLCHPLSFIRQLLYYFPKLASDEYWDSVEELYNQLEKPNKLENSLITIKLCQIMSLLDQGRVMAALLSFSKLSNALKSLTDKPVKSLKSIWTEHHCTHKESPCSAFNSSSLRYFSMQMVEEVRSHLVKLSLDLCLVLFETQKLNSLNDSLLNGIIQQVGLLFLESHLTQNHFTNVYEDFTKGFNQDNLRFFSLLQSVKNLWVSSHKTISCLNCEVDQSSNVFDNFLLYKLYPLSNTQNKDSLLQPAVNAAKKTLEVLPSAAASMFLRPPCMTSDILPQNHILEQTLKDSQEDDNISRHSDVATVVTDLNSSSFSTPFNETKSKALTCLRNSTQNTAYDNSEFLTQQRSFNGDRSIIIPALITEQEALLKNLTGFSNTETFSNHLLDSVQLTQSPLSKSLTLHDPNKKEVEHILQDVNQISRGQEDLSNVIQNQTQITIPNNSAIQEEQQKISPDGENLSRTFPCSFMKADNTFETRENFLFSLPNATAIKKKNSLQYFKPFSVSSTESQDDLNKDISANFTSVLSKKLWSSTSVSDTNHILLRKNRKKHSSVRHFKKSYYQITSHSDTPPSSRKHVNHAENTRNLFPLITNKLCPQLHRTINFSSPASLIRTNSKPSDYFIQKKSVSHNRTALKNNVFHNSESDSYSSNYFTRHHEKLLLEQNKNQTVLQQFSDTEGYVKDISVAPLQRNKKKTFTVVKGKSSSNTANDQNQHSATLQTNEKLLFTHEQEIRKISQRSCNSLTGKKKKNRMPHRSFNIDSFKSHASINQDELLNGSKTNKKCTTKSDSEEHLPIDLDNFYFNNIDKSNKVGQRRIPTVPLNNVREHVKNGEGTKTSDVSDVERNIRQLSITSVPKCNKSTLKILQNESFFFSSTSHNKKTSTDHHANQWEPESANKIDALTEIVNSLKSETCARNKATSSVLLYSNDKKHVTRSFQKPGTIKNSLHPFTKKFVTHQENPLKDLFKNQCPPKPNSPNFLRSLTSAGKWIFSLPFYETQDEKGSLKQINSKIPNYSKNDAVKEKNEEKSFDFSTSFASKDSKKLLGYGRQSNQSDKVLLVTPFRVKKDFKENKAKTCWSDLSSISSLNTISSSSKSRTTFKKSKKNLSTQQKDISGAETHNSFESAQNALTQQMKTEDNVLKQTVKDNNNWDDEIFSLVDSENSSSYNVSNQLYSSTKRNSQSLNRSKNTKEKLSSLNSNEITTFKHNFSKKSISLPIIIEPLNSLHDDFFHDNFNAPTYLDPLLSSSESSDFFFRSLKKSHSFCNETCLNIHSDLHPQKKHKNDERNTWKSQFSSAFFGCTTPANATNAINRGSVALLKRHSISVFPAQSDFQNVNNPAYSRISKHCPNQFDGLQTKIHTNSSSMQDCIDIIPLLSNGSLNTTSNNIHWNTDLEPTLSDLDRKTSFNDSIAIYESLPTLNFQERSCEKMSKDSKTTSAYSHQSPEGKADIINSWKESKSSTHSIQHTVFTEKENDLMNDGNPSLNNCCSEMAQPRGTDKRASKKVSLKSLFTDRLHSTEGHCDSSEVLSSTIRHEKLSAQSKDTTTLPLHSQIFSLENKNEKKPDSSEHNFSPPTRLNNYFFSENNSCKNNEQLSLFPQKGQSLLQKCKLFRNPKKHNVIVYCKTIVFDEEKKIASIQSIFLVKHWKWFLSKKNHISTILGQDISSLGLETSHFFRKLFPNRNSKVIVSTSFKRLTGEKNKLIWSFLKLVLPEQYREKHILLRSNGRKTRKMSVLSTAAVSSLNDKAKVFIWRNSVLLSFDFSRFLLIKSQLPTSETVKSVLVNSKQSLLDEIKFKFLATCFDRRSCTNLFCGTRRKFNGHDKNITPIYRIETPALNKRLWSEPKNAFNARMKSLTLSTNTLKCLTSSNNMMTSEELTQFSSDENKSILSNNLASLGSFVNLSVSKKAKKKSLDDNVILNDQLNTHMCQNPKITVCKNGSLLPLQYTRRFREKFKQNTSVGNAMISETKTLFLNKLKLPGFFKDKAITTVHTAPILTNTKRDSCDKKTLLNNQLKSFSKAPNVVSSLNKNITSANNSEVSLIKEQDVPCPTTVVFSLSHSEDHVENKKTIESIRYDSLYVNQLKTCMTPDEKAQILYNKYDPLNGFSETRPNEGSDTELHKNLHSNQTVPEKNRQACFAPTCRNSVFFTTEEKRRVKQPRLLKFDSHKTPLPPSQASVLQNINLNFNTQSISLLTRERRSLSLPCGLIESGTITLEKTNCKRWSDVQPLTSYSSFTKILNRNGGNTSIRHVREYASSFSKKKHDVITTDSSPVVNTSFARYPLFSRQRNKGGSFNDFNTSPVSNHLPSKNKRKEIFRPQNHLLPQTNQKKIENWSDKLLSSCESENANSINKTFIRMVPNARSLTKPQISSSNHNNQTMSDERVTSPNLKKTFYNHKVDFYKINKENFALNKNDAFSSKALLSKTDNEGNIFLKHSSMSHQHKSIIQDWGDKLLSSSESEDLNSIDKTASAMSASDRFNENTNLSTLTQQTVDQSHQWAISLVPQESPPRSTNHLFSMIKDNSSINQDRSPSLHKMPSVTHNSKNLLYKPSNMYKPNQRAIDAWCDELVLSEYSENSEIITQGVPMSNEFDVATTNQQIIFVCGKSQNQPNGNFISSIEKQNSPFNVNKQFEPKLKSCSKEKKHVNRFNDEASFISNSKDISDKQSLASNLCDKKTHDEKKKNLFSIYSNNLKSSVQKISLNDPSNAPSTSSHVDPVTKEIVRKFEKTTKLHLPNSSISGNYPISGTLNNTTLHTDISDPVSRKRSSKSYFAESIMHDWSDDFLSSSVSESSELISSKLSPLNENYVLPVTAYVSSATKTNAIPSNEKVLSTVSKQFRSSNVRNTVKCEENHSFDNQSNSIISTKPISHTYITKDFFEKSPLTLEENQKIMQNWSNDLLSSNDTENTECS